ncbi:MAG: class I SAM-dependent methyltransferase [bacterium]
MPKMPLKNILSLGRAFWDAQVLLTAVNLKVFDFLDKPATAADVAKRAGLKERTTVMLLDALASLNFLEKKDNKYCVSKIYAPFLLSSSEKNVLSILNHYYFMYEDWGKLKEAVKKDKPVERKKRSLQEFHEFIRGMDNLTKFYKDRVVSAIDINDAKKILDIGSGPATYLREILKKDDKIKGYILDLPDATKVAKEFLKSEGLLKRVTFIKGDIEKADIGRDYDIILISQVLHSLSPKAVKVAFKKAYDALKKGGKLYIHEFYLNEERTFPPENIVFCLNMLLHSDGGNNFTVKELKSLYKEVGFRNIKVKRFKKPYTVMLSGEKL